MNTWSISSLHCQLDTALWIKLLFFRLLAMLYGGKYISASKAFSKWRQSIKPPCQYLKLVMVTFGSITAFASTVISGEEQGFRVHAKSGKADSISVLLVLEKYRRGPSSVRKDFFLTNRMSPGFLVLQPYQAGAWAAASGSTPLAPQSQQRSCKQRARPQTEAVSAVCVALLSS